MCISGNVGAAMAAGEGLPAACNSLFQSVRFENVNGTLTYSGGVEVANWTATLIMDVFYSRSCASALAGVTVTLSASVCSTLQQELLTNPDFTSASCSYVSGGCKCSVSESGSGDSSASYTAAGNTITYSDGDTTEYCVAGNVLTERQPSPPDLPGLTMVATLNRVP